MGFRILPIIIYIVILVFTFMAFVAIKKGGAEITEAANELNNKTLHKAGKSIYRGANYLVTIMIVFFVLALLMLLVPLF